MQNKHYTKIQSQIAKIQAQIDDKCQKFCVKMRELALSNTKMHCNTLNRNDFNNIYPSLSTSDLLIQAIYEDFKASQYYQNSRSHFIDKNLFISSLIADLEIIAIQTKLNYSNVHDLIKQAEQIGTQIEKSFKETDEFIDGMKPTELINSIITKYINPEK